MKILNFFGARYPKVRMGVLSRLVIVIVSSFSTLLVSELLLQVFLGSPEGAHQIFCEHHPILGWQKIPSFTGVHVGPKNSYRVKEVMNSKGLRGPEYTYSKDSEEFRIIALGDSFTEGYSVEFEFIFSQILERKLSKENKRLNTVINAGTGGYSTDQELLWFQLEGKKYGPDLTILMFSSNDILFNNEERYWRGFKPKFVLKNGSLLLTNIPVPKLPQSKPAKKETLLDRSLILSKTRFLLSKFSSKRPYDDNNAASDRKKDPLTLPNYQRLSKWSAATDLEKFEALVITKAILRELKHEVESISSHLIIFLVPDKEAPDIPSIILAMCRELDIDCIDPTRIFQRKAEEIKPFGEQLDFSPYDSHWNSHGHNLAAEVIFNHMMERNLVN